MTRQIFFLRNRIVENESEIILPEDISHHILRVLRLKRGDIIELRDESGRGWKAKISEILKKRVQALLIEEVFFNAESPLDIILFAALARSDLMDLVVRQATELGVKEVVIFPSKRSSYRLEGSKILEKVSRWEKIAREAVCQCRRRIPPKVHYIQTLREALAFLEERLASEEGIKIVATENSNNLLHGVKSKVDNVRKVVVAVGSEGGWPQEELSVFRDYGWYLIWLGPRILKYETAVVALLSLCQFIWGDMGSRQEGDKS
ncbi:MAG: 16S rRNA (uracil(1498)-N(3))-methyltransferase [Syntrophobacterales bacterium]|nr:16S rRNA (uracil(1498)-N(3))-methyltransferase [Syntrophobacterales bacterium]